MSGTAAQVGNAYGGAIFNLNGTVELDNVTMADNTVTAGMDSSVNTAMPMTSSTAGNADGSSVYSLSDGTFTNPSSTLTLKNSILVASSTSSAGQSSTTGPSDVYINQQDGQATLNAQSPNLLGTQPGSAGMPTLNTNGMAPGTVTFENAMSPPPSYLIPASSPTVLSADPNVCQAYPVSSIDEEGNLRGNNVCTLGAIEISPASSESGSVAVGCSLNPRPSRFPFLGLLLPLGLIALLRRRLRPR
jgi:hypothetical protein